MMTRPTHLALTKTAMLEQQLSAERPRWTTSSPSGSKGISPVLSRRSEESSSKPPTKKVKESSKTETPKQPNLEHPFWNNMPAAGVENPVTNTVPAAKLELVHDNAALGDAGTLASSSPGTYRLVLPDKSGPLNLLAQHPDIQAAARLSFIRVERELVTNHAFPNTLIRRGFVRDALAASAKQLGLEALESQILNNPQFSRTLGAIPSQRISTFRLEVKDISQNATTAHYGLVPGSCASKVEWLLGELIYIYPNLDFERNSGSWEKPYGHPLVAHILQQAFFNGPDSVGRTFPDMFKSSLADRQQEPEVPMAMVALAGTAIHAGLLQWQTGQYLKIDFTSNAFLDKYREHITFMAHTQDKNARAFHTMMHNLYKAATGFINTTSNSQTTHAAAAAITRLAIDRMEVS
ncbi:hypothetical protein BC628DRAFT_1036872 [Trametes gibbosa]|nr:hypothetical protein BC628DRAFT_1036872 [Trametes gibbosa]